MRATGLILAIIVVVGVIVAVVACSYYDNPSAVEDYLPSRAKNVKALGHGWYTFELPAKEGRAATFLIKPPDRLSRACAITRIN